MAYEYLNETTFSNDLESQQDIINQLLSNQEQPNQYTDFEEIGDPELTEIVEEQEEENNLEDLEEEPNAEEEPFDYEIDGDPDDTDIQIMNYLLGEQTVPNEGAGSLINTQTYYSDPRPQQVAPRPTRTGRPRIWLPEEEQKYGGRSYQTGGDTLYATTPETQRIGLNDPTYNKAYMNLRGTNTIRGLDNKQPVAVTNGSKYQILKGPKDTASFTGPIFEQRL